MYPKYFFKKMKIKTKVKKEEGILLGERESSSGRDFFLLFSSLSNLRKSDRRFSSGLKAKLIHAARVTRGYQNLGVLSNSTR